MKSICLIIAALAFHSSFSQTETIIKDFDQKKNDLNRNGMIVLGSWAGASVIGSAVGYGLTDSNEEKEFFIMNGAWGLINLSLALPSLLSKAKPSTTFFELQRNQTRMEKIFLANAMLDVAYITGGFYLKELASNQTNSKDQERFNGFGNAVIIQGAGLMVFDIAMTLLSTRNRKKNLDPFLKNATFSFSGNSIRLGYRF
jgi:MFS family permease